MLLIKFYRPVKASLSRNSKLLSRRKYKNLVDIIFTPKPAFQVHTQGTYRRQRVLLI